MTLCHHFRIEQPLHDWMRTLSYREYLTRLAWVRAQWNKPDRSDHYLMQVAMEVRRVLKKKPKEIKLGDFVIPFSFEDQRLAKGPKSREEAAKWAKVKWGMFVGASKNLMDKMMGRGNGQ